MSILTPEGMRKAKAALPDRKGPRVTVSISLADYELDELAWRFVGEMAALRTCREEYPNVLVVWANHEECNKCDEIMAARMLIGGDDEQGT